MTEEIKDPEVVEEPSSSNEHPEHGKLIAESKAYRKRAQAAEEKLAEMEKARKEAEEAKLAEQGEYKTLLEQQKAESEVLSAKAAEWDNYQATRRDQILEGWSTEDVESFGDLPLTKLEAMNRKFKQGQTGGQSPANIPGQAKRGVKFNGYSSLQEWAAKDKESFRKRDGDYPGA